MAKAGTIQEEGLSNAVGTGADIFKEMLNIFNTKIVGKFLDIMDKQFEQQQLMTQLSQSGIVAKRETNDLDELKKKFDNRLEKVLANKSDIMNEYLEIAKDFTEKLKNITQDLVASVKPVIKAQ